MKKINNYKLFLDLESDEPINEEVGLRNLKKIAKGLDNIEQALSGTSEIEKKTTNKC
jgi:sensor histidine kinase YesM